MSQTPKCNQCGETNPNRLVVSSQIKSGYRSICKTCNNDSKRKARENMRLRALNPPPRAPDVVGPRDYVPDGNYVPDPLAYYRNNGNKHIQSRGM
jgi:hypothetical protein